MNWLNHRIGLANRKRQWQLSHPDKQTIYIHIHDRYVYDVVHHTLGERKTRYLSARAAAPYLKSHTAHQP